MKPGNPRRDGGKEVGREGRMGGREEGRDVMAIMKWVNMAWNGGVIGNPSKVLQIIM